MEAAGFPFGRFRARAPARILVCQSAMAQSVFAHAETKLLRWSVTPPRGEKIQQILLRPELLPSKSSRAPLIILAANRPSFRFFRTLSGAKAASSWLLLTLTQ